VSKLLTPGERLVRRVRDLGVIPVPEETVIHRTYAGRIQKQAGAWTWYAIDRATCEEVFGGYQRVTDILRFPELHIAKEASGFYSVDGVHLRCQSCGLRKPTVTVRLCGYQSDINGVDFEEEVCTECEGNHRDTI
jgi:hypothetical protein